MVNKRDKIGGDSLPFECDQKVRICVHFCEQLYPFSPLVRIKKEFSSNKSKLSVVSVKPVTPRLPTAFIKQKQTGDMFSVLLARGCLGCSFFTMLLPITWNGLRVCLFFFSCPVVTPGRLPQHCKLPA